MVVGFHFDSAEYQFTEVEALGSGKDWIQSPSLWPLKGV